MNNPAKVPISEQAQRAREHYEELANMAHHWSSVIPQAIDAWEREMLANNRMHQTAFGVGGRAVNPLQALCLQKCLPPPPPSR